MSTSTTTTTTPTTTTITTTTTTATSQPPQTSVQLLVLLLLLLLLLMLLLLLLLPLLLLLLLRRLLLLLLLLLLLRLLLLLLLLQQLQHDYITLILKAAQTKVRQINIAIDSVTPMMTLPFTIHSLHARQSGHSHTHRDLRPLDGDIQSTVEWDVSRGLFKLKYFPMQQRKRPVSTLAPWPDGVECSSRAGNPGMQ